MLNTEKIYCEVCDSINAGDKRHGRTFLATLDKNTGIIGIKNKEGVQVEPFSAFDRGGFKIKLICRKCSREQEIIVTKPQPLTIKKAV